MHRPIELIDLNNQQARDAAHAKVSWPVNLTPASVSYSSHGHLLIIGSEESLCRRAASSLQDAGFASLSLLITDITTKGDTSRDDVWLATENLPCHYAKQVTVEGYLGQFTVHVDSEAGQVDLATACIARPHFDLILDLGAMPCLALELPPPGYFNASWGSDTYQQALAELPGFIGEFEKPKYFNIDHTLCAHAGRGQPGCTRCLDVCPANAISSHQQRIEAWIEIDPFRCHGAGSCTSVCPTGAIQYRIPEAQRQQDFVRRLLGTYRESGGTQPVVRFAERGYLENETTQPAPHVLDVPLEELGAAGLDHWMGALADGACEVRIQQTRSLPDSLAALIVDQLEQAHIMLDSLGHDRHRLRLLAEDDTTQRDGAPTLAPIGQRASITGSTKRELLNDCLTWLAETGTPQPERRQMPTGAPFGTLRVDVDACTLCMSCVAVCPTPALAGGRDQPQLSFREADCVQCGLCSNACPENAIELVPGFLAASERLERQVCKEEAAFECISCGKPFATSSTISSIKAKLANHPYFAGDAMLRLEMCEDCRVKDVWRTLAKDPNAQLKV